MKNPLKKNSNFFKKVKKIDDTAQETLPSNLVAITAIQDLIKFYYTNMSVVLVALTKDYIKKNEPNLFYGQIGEIAFLPDEKTCWVKFYDYTTQAPKLIHQLKLPKVDVFPLFFLDSLWYKQEIQKKREEFSNSQNLYIPEKNENEQELVLAAHQKSSSRVSVNQLVAVGTDFSFTENNNTVNISVGQVGRISKILPNDLVQVVFESQSLRELILKIESSDFQQNDSFNNWSAQITIHKDYLFYLYYKNLDNSVQGGLYFEDFHRAWRKNKDFMKQFDPNTCCNLDSCVKSGNWEYI